MARDNTDVPTDITEAGIRAYAAAWRLRLAAEREANRRLALDARTASAHCAEVLVERFGVSRVYLFGSLATKSLRTFGARSDIDLAVEGLSDDRFFEALGALGNLTGDRVPIDLVPLETAPPSLKARVLDSGELLRERA